MLKYINPFPKAHIDGVCSELSNNSIGFIVISVNNTPDENFPALVNAVDKMTMVFEDTDVDNGNNPLMFSSSQAKDILDFVAKYAHSEVDALLTQCTAGVSRSPGIAAAIHKILYGHDDLYFRRYAPNRYVYRKLLEINYEFDILKPY
jgi:predicted protein tyrosine phosphatase